MNKEILEQSKEMDVKETEDQQTCGKGLAEHSTLPAKLGELIDSIAEYLEIHMKALDLNDQNAKKEYVAYRKLAKEHREIAVRLTAIAIEMVGYHDLPMGKHDEKAMADPKVLTTFEKLMKIEQELITLLHKRLEQDQKIIAK